MRILVVGAGIGGLAVAALLKRDGHEITLIDSRVSWDKNGYVMGIWGSLIACLTPLGFEKELMRIGYASETLTIPNEKGEILRSFDLSYLNDSFGQLYLVYRPVLHQALRELYGGTVHMGLSIGKLTEKAGTTLATFSNGKQEEFDLVIGSDGIHSQVRRLLWPEVSDSYRPFSLSLWAIMHKVSSPPLDNWMMTGKGKLVGVYPSKEGEACIIFSMRGKKMELTPKETVKYLQETFSDFGDPIPEILSSLSEKQAIYHDETAEVVVKKWFKKRVVLLGDAAHAIIPTAAMGANMAIEDAGVLAETLKKSTSIEQALAQYQKRREARVKRIGRAANFYARLIKIESPAARIFREAFIKTVPTKIFLQDIERTLSEKP